VEKTIKTSKILKKLSRGIRATKPKRGWWRGGDERNSGAPQRSSFFFTEVFPRTKAL